MLSGLPAQGHAVRVMSEYLSKWEMVENAVTAAFVRGVRLVRVLEENYWHTFLRVPGEGGRENVYGIGTPLLVARTPRTSADLVGVFARTAGLGQYLDIPGQNASRRGIAGPPC